MGSRVAQKRRQRKKRPAQRRGVGDVQMVRPPPAPRRRGGGRPRCRRYLIEDVGREASRGKLLDGIRAVVPHNGQVVLLTILIGGQGVVAGRGGGAIGSSGDVAVAGGGRAVGVASPATRGIGRVSLGCLRSEKVQVGSSGWSGGSSGGRESFGLLWEVV